MANEIQAVRAQAPAGAEHTRDRKVFIPPVDIVESPDAIILTADMPGVDDKNVSVTLEKGVLSVLGEIEPASVKDRKLAYAEYEIGDYERAFTLSDEIDQDRIEATVKNGILRLVLPKTETARARRIPVKTSR
ncbi:MAG TPA: Hsp20/alpha crystallin family protein [Syntrophales bacterium]|nr:Hsp20/alpha crystallin family protein [Syntrophobacterales bacterium]HNQ00707.1 Hsp20/alpha crystallin family protein [Syntrophales bacterium]HNS53447.1 Hsp20/alpha crystallin family protein [Syntrophales bacterium]HPG72447.1 Hsp20/alpha crystallin family protein [Syntrophales bacterium]HQL89519.1 Hsp20/alpha crystallin family protein [Syntrophales bacterium]